MRTTFYLTFVKIINPKTQKEIFWLSSFDSILRKVCENKELWIEFQNELRRRNVVTSLATKEILTDFLRTRMNVQVNDYATEPLTHVVMDWDCESNKRGNEFFVASNLRANLYSPLKCVLPHFESNNMTFGNKLGKGSQSVVYEVQFISTKTFDSRCKKESAKECSCKNHWDGIFHLISCTSKPKQQLAKNYAAKFPRDCNDNEKYKKMSKHYCMNPTYCHLLTIQIS